MTFEIPRLVASHDTHKGKPWLNSNPPSHRGFNHVADESINHVADDNPYHHEEWKVTILKCDTQLLCAMKYRNPNSSSLNYHHFELI